MKNIMKLKDLFPFIDFDNQFSLYDSRADEFYGREFFADQTFSRRDLLEKPVRSIRAEENDMLGIDIQAYTEEEYQKWEEEEEEDNW